MELIQLAFNSHDDTARREFVDTGIWMNLGSDVFSRGCTPEHLQPGVGLRPLGRLYRGQPFKPAARRRWSDPLGQ